MKLMPDRARIAKPDGNTDTDVLKWIALAFMIVDHLGSAFFRDASWMRIVGRVAFPIYIWCMVVGCSYTRNIWKYLLRLLIGAVISQPFYMWGLAHQWYELNVIFTLLLGCLGIALIQTDRFGSRWWGPVAVLLIACLVHIDYGWRGVLLVIMMYACREKRAAVGVLLFAFSLYWGSTSSNVMYYFGLDLTQFHEVFPYGDTLFSALFKTQFFAVFALPFILPRRKRGEKHLPVWIGYLAYPGHLAVIALVRNWTAVEVFLSKIFGGIA